MNIFRNIFFTIFILSFIFIAPVVVSGQNAQLEIRYVANAGVLINWQDMKILIDGIHHSGNPYYPRVNESDLKKIIAGTPPFNDIDFIIATHVHQDHFDAASVLKVLENHRATRFISTAQVSEQIFLIIRNYKEIRKQIITATPYLHEMKDFRKYVKKTSGLIVEIPKDEYPDLDIHLLGLKHGSKKFETIKNVGILLRLGDYTLLHVGDAEAISENFKSFNLPEKNIDIAFLPYWYLVYTDSFRRVVNESIRPAKIIAVHIPDSENEEIADEIKRYYPTAIPFISSGQTVKF